MSDLTIANTIRDQIGSPALYMLGAQYLVGDERSLGFKIRGSKQVNHIKIILDSSDTYTMEFRKVGRAKTKLVNSISYVYWDQLKDIIESETGLYTSL